ncbi:hypothetical protein ONJ45_25950, partial [Salmonella enterica subsp. enterica serovar Virginia]|nr:hypothetical protein [Salmonella enterica subsp. enterica serovar Virginia]
GQLLTTSQNALALLADGEDVNLQSQLYSAKQLVSELVGMDSKHFSRPPITRQKATVNVSSSALSLSAPKRDSAYNKGVRINLTVS